jgi:hypothetical protein
MKAVRTIVALAALALLTAPYGVMAQTKPVPGAAQTTGEMSPQQKVDEGVVKATKPAPSNVDRKALQKDAAAARKAGATVDGECGPEQKADAGVCKKAAVDKSTPRAEVKKEAAAANKAGATNMELSAAQKKDEGVVRK